MSKANRIKGKFDPVANCRMGSPSRYSDLEGRNIGLDNRHKPTVSKRTTPKLTKSLRKSFIKLVGQGNDENHPLERKATLQERGHAIYMSLISSVTMQPEGK